MPVGQNALRSAVRGQPHARVFRSQLRRSGEILQKLRNYKIRLAVVCAPGRVQFSSRFGEMLAEERSGPYFGVFDTRADARAWLAQPIV